MVTVLSAQAQIYTVLHNFTGGDDGAHPRAGLTLDPAGNIYGTTSAGAYTGGKCGGPGLNGCGSVFKLKHTSSGSVLTPLYAFQYTDGAAPWARVILGPEGILYGTTRHGANDRFDGDGVGCGVVFSLRPPATISRTALSSWTETVLFKFSYYGNGCMPFGDLAFDQVGNIYGTTVATGSGWGIVWELTPSNGGWTEDTLYIFPNRPTTALHEPYASVIFDSAGNLYGPAAFFGAYGYGGVYQLTPSGSGWTEQDLYDFQGGDDGRTPYAGLIRDSSGNLYGTTLVGGVGGGGTVYKLSPSNGGWTLTTLYSFTGSTGPYATLTMDGSGAVYGTTFGDGAYGNGNVFKLSPSNGAWTYTSLYDFTGGSDGGGPQSNVVRDANGNLYGTTYAGGTSGNGVIWEITP